MIRLGGGYSEVFSGFLKIYSKILKVARSAAKNPDVFGVFPDLEVFSGASRKKVWCQ